jgi:NAD(P)-dependent dehydrogenase (short-subunit alcohol dehydrogenase family)
MFDQRFPEKRAFITGAASGLGLEICERLARDGWRLLIVDINAERLAAVEESLQAMGGTIISEVLNVTDVDAIDAVAARIKRQWGGVDIIFNNAGVAGGCEFDRLSLEEWQRLININLWSVIYGCRAFVPLMKAQGGGYIVNTASSAGILSSPQMANYNVAKAGVISLSETLKVELSPFNIGVTVICPTVFKTDLGSSVKTGSSMEANIQRQLSESKVMPADIVDATFKVMQKNKLYVMPQLDARWTWRFKRFSPGGYLRLLSYLYNKRKWLYAYLD